MQVITKIPSDYQNDDNELFEFIPIKRASKTLKQSSDFDYSLRLFSVFKNFNFENQYPYANIKNYHKNVVIKNIGNMTQNHLKNALNYVLKNSDGKLGLNEYFEQKSFKEIIQEWKDDFSSNPNTKEGMHLVFSIKEPHSNSIMELLKTSVYETMRNNFNEYQFILVPHSHQNNPHIHCIINKTNTYTGNKLRFAKKSDCRDFFFKLKEDFKNELYYWSGGKIDYKNDIRLQLDSIFKELDCVNQASVDFNHQSFYKKSIEDLNKKYVGIQKSIQALESQTHKTQSIQNKISSGYKNIKKIQSDMKNLVNWNENFVHFSKSFDLYQKKKALYDSIYKIKPNASKVLFKHLSILKNQLSDEKTYIQGQFNDIKEGFDKNIFLNPKTNIFALNKYLKQLKTYRLMLKKFQSDTDEKNKDFDLMLIFDHIHQKEKEVFGLIELRVDKLIALHKNLKTEVLKQNDTIDQSLSDLSSLSLEKITEIIKLSGIHLRNLKGLNFIHKELLLAKKILKDINHTVVFKGINQENQNEIEYKIKTMQKSSQGLNKLKSAKNQF
ncbi:relaxase/mobilization nuclease domain-containing protein [Helicobacter sp. 13S00477-4]|uniref:relaxase/mobilization nuclease domain-containing protein n=1 Tax=Helicobacter sp. 13S00477-4 TaxID=1905759 RepID=UPI000BA6E618|nr:relaxase/mobilization nuclease domain-containing protein [Helicobacter sp. 13S00477-4]PAF50471.1 hypothetical protein BKH44_08140 [Helicobacter sp. 13S00477-4]